MSFPSSLPSYAGFTATHTLAQDGHAAQENQQETDIIAIATKMGTGSSTPTANTFLRGSGVGTSDWSNVNLSGADVNGTLPTSKFDTIAMLGLIYPVGCIYTETTGVNPGTTFGFGTWTQTGKGRVLIGQGTSDQLFNAGDIGGESNHSLTTNEMPSHTHTQNSHTHPPVANTYFVTSNTDTNNGGSGSSGELGSAGQAPTTTGATTAVNQNTGGSASHNNLQPYQVVYFWQRTA